MVNVYQRRDVLRSLASAGVLAAGAWPALAQTPRRGGRIRVASMSSSTADTLDPAKGALSTDYARHYMTYSGLTQYDARLAPQLVPHPPVEADPRVEPQPLSRRGLAQVVE